MKIREFSILWLGSFGFWACLTGLALILPLYMQHAGYTAGNIGFITGIAALGGLLSRPFIGWSVDRFGTRYFLLLGVGMWMITSPLVAITSEANLLILLRLIQGVGAAMFTAAALGYVGFVTPHKQRGRIISWWDTSGSAANLFVPVLLAAIIGVSGFITALWTAALAGGIGFVLLGFLPQVVPAEKKSAEQAKIRLFVRSAVVPGFFAIVAGIGAGGFIVLAPLIAETLGLKNVGIFILLFSLGTVIVRPIAAPLSDSKGRAAVVLPGFIFISIGLAILGINQSLWTAYVSPLIFGIGLGSVVPGLMAMSIDGSKPEERGKAGNTFYSFWELGIFLGAYFQGILLDSAGLASFMLPAGICAVSSLVFWFRYRNSMANIVLNDLGD